MSDNVNIADINGKNVVEINTIKFSGKRKIDWEGVERYLKQFVGNQYVVEETGDTVYIGTDFPDEYTHSKYKEKSFGTIGKAKANATQAIPELIKTVSNLTFRSNLKDKHAADASGGWFYGEVHFSIPITDDKKKIVGSNSFRGRMIMRQSNDGKRYLYDIIDIKKET